MTFNYPRNASLVGDKISLNKSGIYNLDSRSLYPYADDQLYALNSALGAYTDSTAVSTVVTTFSYYGYEVIATPTYNAMAELLIGTNAPITTKGVFRYDIWDEQNALATTAGYGTVPDGHPWIGMAGFNAGTYHGSLIMAYTGSTGNVSLKSLWYPNQYRSLNAFLLNPDGSSQSFTNANSSTIFSNGQSPGVNGYYTTSNFAADDGVWGYADGSTLNGNGGAYLLSSVGHFGCQNSNSGDSTATTFYWNGTATSSTTYVFYIFIKKV